MDLLQTLANQLRLFISQNGGCSCSKSLLQMKRQFVDFFLAGSIPFLKRFYHQYVQRLLLKSSLQERSTVQKTLIFWSLDLWLEIVNGLSWRFLYGSAGLGLRVKKMVVGLGILWIFWEGDLKNSRGRLGYNGSWWDGDTFIFAKDIRFSRGTTPWVTSSTPDWTSQPPWPTKQPWPSVSKKTRSRPVFLKNPKIWFPI